MKGLHRKIKMEKNLLKNAIYYKISLLSLLPNSILNQNSHLKLKFLFSPFLKKIEKTKNHRPYF